MLSSTAHGGFPTQARCQIKLVACAITVDNSNIEVVTRVLRFSLASRCITVMYDYFLMQALGVIPIFPASYVPQLCIRLIEHGLLWELIKGFFCSQALLCNHQIS